MRGGLDDALDKLARRDELRRRAAGEATGTPPAVHDLVEAIASVVGRNPKLEVTVGVEGVGDPTLLHFFVEDGVVQVNADSTVAARVTDAATSSPRHADFDVEVDETAETARHTSPAPARSDYVQPAAYAQPAAYPPPAAAAAAPSGFAEPDQDRTRRISYDDRDRYDPGTGYGTTPYGDPDPYTQPTVSEPVPDEDRYRSPFAATPPPPVPPRSPAGPRSPASAASRPEPLRIRPEDLRPPHEAAADERMRAAQPASPAAAQAFPEQRGMPKPLAEPIPLHVDSAATEQAAKRLSALLRENPSLLRPTPPQD